MSKTARVLPRLFNRASNSAPSTSSVPLSSSRGAPESSGSSGLLNLRNRKRRRGRKLSDFTSIVEWERVYFQRKKTLLMKAMELEEATGAIVTVTIQAPTGETHYYANSDVTVDLLKESGLLGSKSHHVSSAQLKASTMDSILSHIVRRNSTVASETSATPTCPQVVDKMETCQEAAVSRPTQRPSLNAEKKLNKLPVRSSIPQAQPIRLVKPVPSQPGTSHITQQQPSPESSDSESSDSSSSDSSAATIPHPILLQRAAKMLTSEMNESKKRKNPSNISELEAKQQTLPAQAASRVDPASDTRPPPTSGMSTQESTPQSNSLCSTPVLDRGHKPGFTNNEQEGTRKLNAGTSLKLTKSKTTISPSGDPVSGLKRRSSGFASNGRSAFRLSQNLQRKRSFEVRPTGRSCGSTGTSSGGDPAPPNNSWRRDRDYRNRRESLDFDKLKEVKTEASQHLMENEVISTRESFKGGCAKVKVKEENDGSCEVHRESPKSSEDLDEKDDLLQSTCWPPENYSEQLSQERSRGLDSSSNSRCRRRKS